MQRIYGVIIFLYGYVCLHLIALFNSSLVDVTGDPEKSRLEVFAKTYDSLAGNPFSVLGLACKQAPGGASTEQTPGAKRRAIGACTHSPKLRCLPRRDCAVNCQISTNQHTPDVKIQNQSKQI